MWNKICTRFHCTLRTVVYHDNLFTHAYLRIACWYWGNHKNLTFTSQRVGYVELWYFLLHVVWRSCWTKLQVAVDMRRHDAHVTSQQCIRQKPSMYSFIPPTLNYRQTSDINRTKFQNLNISRLVLQLSLPYPLKPGIIKSRLNM